MKEKAKELLGLNIPANVVADAIGVDASLISQWMGDEAFAAEVIGMKIANTAAHAARDKEYDSIEDALVGRLKTMLESDLIFTKPVEILSAIRIINAAKRRATPAELNSGGGTKTFLTLQLPENAEFAARFIVNNSNQVVEIAGRSIATMGAKQVVKRLEELNANGALPKGTAIVDHQNDKDDAMARLKGLVKLDHLEVPTLADQL